MSALYEWRNAIRRPPPGMELKPTDRLVALILSFYMDTDTLENARPGPARLSSETGLAPRTIKTSLLSLSKAGWIAQTSKGGTRRGGSAKKASTYRGILPTSAERAPVQEDHGSTRAPGSLVPVQEDHGTRAGDAHHLVTDLDKNLGGSDPVALAASLCSRPTDELTRYGEVKGKLAPFRRRHGDGEVFEVIERFDAEGLRFGFAKELVPELEAAFPDDAPSRPERHSGYVPGHQPSANYPHSPQPAFELDENGNAVRIA